MKPFQHQLSAIEFSMRTPRALFCHAPGLGKTRTALWAAQKRGFNRLVIMHPAKIARQWRENVEAVFPGRKGIHQFSWDSEAALAVLPQLRAGDIVFEDEVHYIKNANSKRFLRLGPVLHQAIVGNQLAAIGLSATPVYSYVQDAFTELYALGLVPWDQRTAFLSRYCKVKEGVNGFSFNDANESTLPELKRQLSQYVHFVTWESSGIQMPPVTMEDFECPLDLGVADQLKYRDAAADFAGWYQVNKGHPAPPLARFVTLRVLLAMAKVASAFRQLESELRVPNFKILLFTSFKEPLFALKRMCDARQIPAFVHTGDESIAEREKALQAFADYQGSAVLLGSTASLGDSRDKLQFSTHRIFFLDVSYSPSEYTQAIGRLKRLGQINSVAVLRFFVPSDALENHIVEYLGRKETFIKQLGLLNEGMSFTALRGGK
jgi:SNF2 family DNA or RNA helicase